MNRPDLDGRISLSDFNDFYWLKQELVAFCKSVGISTSGSKLELSDRIRHFISTGEVQHIQKNQTQKKSTFDWRTETLTRATLITDNYANGEHVRRFFMHEIGPHFSFNVVFMKWIKEHVGHTLGDAICEWQRIHALKKDKNYVRDIDPQFEYNRYMRAFLNDNPDLSSKDAVKYWMLKRSRRGSNEYDRSDLLMG